MRICDTSSSLGRLQLSLKALNEAWAEAKKYWHDHTAKRFEDDQLEIIRTRVNMTATAVSRLTNVLDKAEQELEDRDRGEW